MPFASERILTNTTSITMSKEELEETSKPEEAYRTTFLNYISKERRLSDYTQRNYSHAIELFFSYLRKIEGWTGDLNEVKTNLVRNFIIDQQRTHAKRTVHNWISALRSFFNYWVKHKALISSPLIGITLPKLDKKLPLFLSEKNMVLLLKGPLLRLEAGVLEPFQAWRDLLILELLYGGGLRVSELVNLNYGAINLMDGCARVLGKGKKERICPLGAIALECLIKFKNEFANDSTMNAPIILNDKQGRMGVRQVQLKLKEYLKLAGLPLDLTPHKIRHSYATHMLNHGANLRLVQALLGHTSLSTTQIYTHVNAARLKEAHQLAHPRS